MNQIQVKWDRMDPDLYDESLVALRSLDEEPASIKASLNIKGDLPKVMLDRVVAVCKEYEVKISGVLTATWPEAMENPSQLKLFGPDGS